MPKTPITINIDNTLLPQAVAALNWRTGYQVKVEDPNNPGTQIDNPVTPQQNAKQAIAAFVKNAITDYQNQQALQNVQQVDTALIS